MMLLTHDQTEAYAKAKVIDSSIPVFEQTRIIASQWSLLPDSEKDVGADAIAIHTLFLYCSTRCTARV